MITAKLKLVGVEPHVVGALHEAVKNSKFTAPEGYKTETNPAHVTILDCRLDKEYGTYTVSLDLHLHTECSDAERVTAYTFEHPKYLMYQSVESLRRILRSVDSNLLPDEEDPIPADDETRKILARRAKEAELKRVNNEINDLLNPLKGRSFDFDIFDANGKVALRAGRVLNGDYQFNLHNRILNHGLKLDSVTDDAVRAILHKANEASKTITKV